jgi:lipoprotein-anchoring transpeptidase ErfK/SrfK
VLRRAVDHRGRLWLLVRVPGRPNGRAGWVRRPALGGYARVTTRLHVDRARRVLTLTRNGTVLVRSRVAVGLPRSPTPAGRYIVRSRIRNLGGDPLYGPVAFGLTAIAVRQSDWPGGEWVGIHGTDRPHLIPGRVSRGCIRVRNPTALRLWRALPVGTPVVVT